MALCHGHYPHVTVEVTEAPVHTMSEWADLRLESNESNPVLVFRLLLVLHITPQGYGRCPTRPGWHKASFSSVCTALSTELCDNEVTKWYRVSVFTLVCVLIEMRMVLDSLVSAIKIGFHYTLLTKRKQRKRQGGQGEGKE